MRWLVAAIVVVPALALGEPAKLDTAVTVRVDDDNKALAAAFKDQLGLKQGTRADACWHKSGRLHAKLGFDNGKVTSVEIDQLDDKAAKECVTKVLKAVVLANAHGHSTADVALDARERKVLDSVLDAGLSTNLAKFKGIKADGAGQPTGTGVGTVGGTGTRGHGVGGGGTAEGDFVSGNKVATDPKDTKVTVGPLSSSTPAADGELTREEIDRVMRSRGGVFRACYQKELSKEPNLAGKVMIMFKIAADGAVASAKVETTTLKSAAVEACLSAQILRLKFPAKSEATVVHYPLMFVQGN